MSVDHLLTLYYRARFYLDVPVLLQLLKFQRLRDAFYDDLWPDAARKVGAECTRWRFGYWRISRNDMTTMVKNSLVMLDDHLMLDIMGNKALTYELLREKGCAVPEFCLYHMRSFQKAKFFFFRYGGPLVVKPARGTGGGRGVTTGITTLRALRRASILAARFGGDILVERQIEGDSFRLLFLDGKFIDAVRRDPPILVGDGRHTIRQLIRIENRRRLNAAPVRALSPLKLDRDCRNKLAASGISPRRRLEKGRVIEVKQAVNENSAARNHVVRQRVHPTTIELGSKIVRDLGVRFAGLDLICRDIAAPLTPENGRFGEINTTPGIHHHYLVANPAEAAPVAEIVLSHLFATGQGVMILGQRSPQNQDRAA